MSLENSSQIARRIILSRWRPISAYPDVKDAARVLVELPQHNTRYHAIYTHGNSAIPHMPIILKADNSPWVEGNLYLIHRVEKESLLRLVVNMEALCNRATDLLDYLRFIEQNNIDFKYFPRKKLLRPTFRYRSALETKVNLGEIADTTAARRWSVIVDFYRTNNEQAFFDTPEHPPFDDIDRHITFVDRMGIERSTIVKSTKQAVRVVKKAKPDEVLSDGGQLRPLSIEEQLWLIEKLKTSPNIEMRLMHWVALFTGARVQSVCSLRLKHVSGHDTNNGGSIHIAAGHRTGIDTKNDKCITLTFPCWLIRMLAVYSTSERALRRRDLFAQDWGDDSFVFLSKSGRPFYRSKYDALRGRGPLIRTKQPLEANAVRQFVRTTRESIRAKHPGFYYRFHDLRATFGVNLVEGCRKDIDAGRMTYTQALHIVRDRMGHSRLSTTELYLSHRPTLEASKKLNSAWENELASILYIDRDGSE